MKEHYEYLREVTPKGQEFTVPEKVDELWPGLGYLDRRMRVENIYDYLHKDEKWGKARKVGRKACGATRQTVWVIE